MKEEDRTTPFGLWRYGNDFRQAALGVMTHHHGQVFMPYFFLLGQSIELSLKGFLLGRGIPLTELRSKKYGHNLKALLDEARKRKLGNEAKLTNAHCAVIHLLGIEYLAKRFQYIKTGHMTIPEPWLAQEAADLLSNGLKSYCFKRTSL